MHHIHSYSYPSKELNLQFVVSFLQFVNDHLQCKVSGTGNSSRISYRRLNQGTMDQLLYEETTDFAPYSHNLRTSVATSLQLLTLTLYLTTIVTAMTTLHSNHSSELTSRDLQSSHANSDESIRSYSYMYVPITAVYKGLTTANDQNRSHDHTLFCA